MKVFLFSCSAVFLSIAPGLSADPAPAASPKGLPKDTHFTPGWLKGATRLQSGTRAVYYRGSINPAKVPASGQWTGTITGDILVLSPVNATIIPTGTVILYPGEGIGINGPHKTLIADPKGPAWAPLLTPPSAGR